MTNKTEEQKVMTIKDARKAAGLTQQQMADMTGIPKRTIQNWEGGINEPPKWVSNLVIDKLEQIRK